MGKKPTANIILIGERLMLSPEDQKKGKDVHSYHSYNIGNPSQCRKARKEIKGTQIKRKK